MLETSIQKGNEASKLAGVPDKTFSATIGTIEISEAGDQIRMGNFRSETEFVETALNRYVPEVIEISNSAAQAVLSKARVILQLPAIFPRPNHSCRSGACCPDGTAQPEAAFSFDKAPAMPMFNKDGRRLFR